MKETKKPAPARGKPAQAAPQKLPALPPGYCSEYHCPSCKSVWRSNNREPRDCKKCNIKVYPSNTVPDKRTDYVISNNLNKPNTTQKTVNKNLNNANQGKPKEHLLGEFKCPRCNIAWKSTYYGTAQQCNKCQQDVVPNNLVRMRMQMWWCHLLIILCTYDFFLQIKKDQQKSGFVMVWSILGYKHVQQHLLKNIYTYIDYSAIYK